MSAPTQPRVPKCPFVVQVCGRSVTVRRAPLKDSYGESVAWTGEVVINNSGEYAVPASRFWEVLVHELTHLALAYSGHTDEDHSATLTGAQEEAVCIVAESVWLTMSQALALPSRPK